LFIGENVEEILQGDLKLELIAHPDLAKDAITHCEQVGDYGFHRLFVAALESEEHIDWIETQLELIRYKIIASQICKLKTPSTPFRQQFYAD